MSDQTRIDALDITRLGPKLKKEQVAELFGVSTKTIERKSKSGVLPAPDYSLGERNPRWHTVDLLRFFPTVPQDYDSRNASR